MENLQFYYNPQSRGRIVHWMLEEVGVPYEMKILDFKKGDNKAPDFLDINPMGKVPTIVHRGNVVTEAAAICAYLADAFPANNLAPALSSPERGTYYRWMFFAAGCVEPAITDKVFGRKENVPSRVLGYGNYTDTIHALETAVNKGPFILGEHFSAADVYVGAQIGWGMATKGIEPRPAFIEYVTRCEARPAFKRFEKKANELAAQLQNS